VIRFRRRLSLWAAWDRIGHVAQAGVQWGSLSPRDPRSGLLRACWRGDDEWFAWCHHNHAVARLWRAVHHWYRAFEEGGAVERDRAGGLVPHAHRKF